MSTNSINGILMADIASINGQDVPSGGGGVAESSDGVLYFEAGGFNPNVPDADEIFAGEAVALYKAQISSRTDIVRLKGSQWHIYALSSDNKLYSMGYTNQGYMGRSITGSANEPTKLVECLTSVSKFQPHSTGCWAIKTDGTLWWTGNIGQYANSSDTGQSTLISSYGWLQYQSDTDWVDVFGWANYPTAMFATKGSSGSEYLYTCGYNNYGRTGLGTTSGLTKPWTRVKSDASTDWAEPVSKVDIGYNATVIVTTSGKFFAIGDANYGALGQGNTTDVSYPVQIGTDTDWATPFDGRNISYCIKTDGTLYASTYSTSFYEIRGSTTNRTYSQVGTDSDYQEIRTIENNTSSGKELIFAKKNNAWYANWNETFTNGFMGSGTSSPPGTNTWVTVNEMLTGNDITPAISDILITYKGNSSNGGNTVVMATEAHDTSSYLLLNSYSGAEAAYSLRKIDKDYTGSCIRIRRDSDDTETDIGFDSSGVLHTSDIASFVGSGNTGYLVKWYDQSGNSADMTATASQFQPKIYASNAVPALNGKPAVDFGITPYGKLYGETNSISIDAISMFVVCSGPHHSWDHVFGSGTNFNLYNYGDGKFGSRYNGTHYSQNTDDNNQNLHALIAGSTHGGFRHYVNQTGQAAMATTLGNSTATGWGMGAYSSGSGYPGKLQEIILWGSDQSGNQSNIESNQNSYYSIY